MNADLIETTSDVSRDLSPTWLELSSRVRGLALDAKEGPDSALAAEALLLCGHVEQLHADVEQLLQGLKAEDDALAGSLDARVGEPTEVDRANIQIQREMHQKSDLRQVIKALFMWKDDPVQRVREHVD